MPGGLCTPWVDTQVGRITVCATTTDYPTGLNLYEGKVVWLADTNRLMLYSGTEWREVIDIDGWATWTPVLSGTGYAIGNGTIGGLYRVHPNKEYDYIMVLAWGSTSTAGAGPMTLSTPATFLNTNTGGTGIGHTDILASSDSMGSMYDSSATEFYPLRLNYASTTTNAVQCISYNGAAAGIAYAKWANVTSTIPVAPAQFDVFRFHGRGFVL